MNVRSLRARLHQESVWVDGKGRKHAVAEMDRRHAANAAALLERVAGPLHSAEIRVWVALPEPNGTQAAYEVDDEIQRLFEADPVEWVRGTPLHHALVARADGHPGGPSLCWRFTGPLRRVIA